MRNADMLLVQRKNDKKQDLDAMVFDMNNAVDIVHFIKEEGAKSQIEPIRMRHAAW